MILFLWTSKFGTAKIEYSHENSFEMGKKKPLGVIFILLLIAHCTGIKFKRNGQIPSRRNRLIPFIVLLKRRAHKKE